VACNRILTVKLPDELETELRLYKQGSETAIQEIAVRTALATIPFAGSALLEIFNGLAQRRAQERLNDLFGQMRSRLNLLGEEKVDRDYFHSAEFQSLLFLLIDKLHTTHDAERLRMFGNALGNAANVDFKSDDKEQYVRVLRDLSLGDLKILNDEKLKGWLPHLPHVNIDYAPEILVSIYRLQAMGLVIAKLRQKGVFRTGDATQDIQNVMSNLSTQPPVMTFYLSGFGTNFLRFILPEDQVRQTPTA